MARKKRKYNARVPLTTAKDYENLPQPLQARNFYQTGIRPGTRIEYKSQINSDEKGLKVRRGKVAQVFPYIVTVKNSKGITESFNIGEYLSGQFKVI